jgi:hypothetical protein
MVFNNAVSIVSGVYYQIKPYNLLRGKYKAQKTIEVKPFVPRW